jgi:magnesium and cobalt transporter
MDGIIGMVHVKDVFAYLADLSKPRPRIEQLLRSVLFVPPSMRVIDLLARMRASRVHMAIVVDEYGGTDGLVTIEDLVEQIVGQIEDEHDDAQAKLLHKLSGGLYDADARLPLEELQSTLKVEFVADVEDADDIDTVGGLIFYLAGRVPAIGETIIHDSGYRFEILDGDPRRVTRVRVLPPEPQATEAA